MLCVALAVFAATAAIVHVHPHASDGGPNATHCLICVAAHAPTVLTSVVAPLPAVTSIRGTISLPESDPHSRLLSPDLFIRPPPATV
ncbi:MAG: hypothetical protein LAN70_05080 [Acidobacteriia bacterium]|nr:hypothetical protein [Terriglobia bacterium]